MSFCIVGIGNMGSAFAERMLTDGMIAPESLFLCDQNEEKLEKFEQKGCVCSPHAKELIRESKTILLAIKPQSAHELLNAWKSVFNNDQIIISMMAGVSIKNIQEMTGVKKIIRIMPNTPLLVNAGVIGYFFSEGFLEKEKKEYSAFLERIACSVACTSEDHINAITALSGSGPAYYFRLMEIMQEQAIEWGFSETQAKAIALQTLSGASALVQQTNDSFTLLREKVTSKGGTTEAALRYFTENGFEEIWKTGMQKAKERAEALQ